MNSVISKLIIQPDNIETNNNTTILYYNFGIIIRLESCRILIEYLDGDKDKIKPTEYEYINKVLEEFSNAS